MNLTEEQQEIVLSTGNARINAVAGSGKTSTVIEYAKARRESAILYLVYNKSARKEAVIKFRNAGLDAVHIETAHSFAYKTIVEPNKDKYQLCNGYKSNQLVELLEIKKGTGNYFEYVMANHISRMFSYFCNSDKFLFDDLDYMSIVPEANKSFATNYYDYIKTKARDLFKMMNEGRIEITHDFYLKKFQLLKPTLKYDYILFDEGQDASGTMLEVFLRQKGTKVIVGDTHQQIYGWRFAVNSLDKARFKSYNLSNSFRFSQQIADLANEILSWKNLFSSSSLKQITGRGTCETMDSHAVIARTNLSLLSRAIDFIDNNQTSPIYFEGNLSSYTYAEDGASLYDVLNLSLGNYDRIRNRFIAEFMTLEELKEYVEQAGDYELSMMIDIVEKYGSRIFSILKTLREMQVDGDKKDRAAMIFSTVHKSKGMEYDVVELCDDFVTKDKVLEILETKQDEPEAIAKLNEEINILYVAITRTKNVLSMPSSIFPRNVRRGTKIKLNESVFELV